jgi:hypothetical protein
MDYISTLELPTWEAYGPPAAIPVQASLQHTLKNSLQGLLAPRSDRDRQAPLVLSCLHFSPLQERHHIDSNGYAATQLHRVEHTPCQHPTSLTETAMLLHNYTESSTLPANTLQAQQVLLCLQAQPSPVSATSLQRPPAHSIVLYSLAAPTALSW